MSIYSGFATRNQEQIYDNHIYDLIFILSKKIIKLDNHEQIDEQKFTKFIKQIFIKMNALQQQKYLQPNISSALFQLMQHLLNKQKQPNESTKNKKQQWIKIERPKQQSSLQLPNNKNNYSLKNKRFLLKSLKNTKYCLDSEGKIANLNPQIKQTKRIRKIQSSLNKFNQTNKIFSQQKISNTQSNIKHKSLRNFQINESNQTKYLNKTFRQRNQSPNYKQRKQIKQPQSLGIKQPKDIRIVMPQLVKQYISSTNQQYMKNFRKRKIIDSIQPLMMKQQIQNS